MVFQLKPAAMINPGQEKGKCVICPFPDQLQTTKPSAPSEEAHFTALYTFVTAASGHPAKLFHAAVPGHMKKQALKDN